MQVRLKSIVYWINSDKASKFLNKAQCDFLKNSKIKEKQHDGKGGCQSSISWPRKERSLTIFSAPFFQPLCGQWAIWGHLQSKVMLISTTDSTPITFKALGFLCLSSGFSWPWNLVEILLLASFLILWKYEVLPRFLFIFEDDVIGVFSISLN